MSLKTFLFNDFMRNHFSLLGLMPPVCPNFASQDSSQKKGSPPGSPANM